MKDHTAIKVRSRNYVTVYYVRNEVWIYTKNKWDGGPSRVNTEPPTYVSDF